MGACAKKSYNPYKDGKVPPPSYQGRPDDRLVELKEYDEKVSPKPAPPPKEPEKYAKFANPNAPKPTFGAVADYRLGAGDILEIIYQLRNVERQEAYQLSVLDVVEVSFQYTPEFNRKLTVRTDGKISFPLIGDVQAVGKSTAQLLEELQVAYGKFLKEPNIELTVVESNRAIEELKRAITTAPRGQSRLEPVRPDGFISLPLIGDIRAAERTVPELSQSIVDEYRKARVVDIDVTVVLLEVKSTRVQVFGEVGKPGTIVLQGPTDVWRAIGDAGGFGNEADARHVIVAKSGPGGEERFVLDFFKWQQGTSFDDTITVNRGDIVYVPKANNRSIYIAGEVEKPQAVRLDPTSKMYASQALAMGGRILSSANRGQILILRKSVNGEPVVIDVDLKAITDRSNYNDKDDYAPRDPLLEPGDVVYVPASHIGSVDRFAEAWFRNGIWTIIPFNLNATYSLNGND